MGKYNLTFISDENLFNHVKETVLKYSFDMDLSSFNKNLIDPIKFTFDSIVYDNTIENTIENEILRQLDKTNSNLIGYFHQNLFKYLSIPGWNVPKTGYDIVNEDENIYVEMKNKHNTMNSSSGAKTYMRMQNTLIEISNAQCLLVEVIATKSQDIPWVVTLDGAKQKSNNQIRRVSIDKFYELVTKEKDAFAQLCSILPTVIKDVVNSKEIRMKNISVIEEFKGISDDLLTSIYLLSFKKYEGFNNFKIK